MTLSQLLHRPPAHVCPLTTRPARQYRLGSVWECPEAGCGAQWAVVERKHSSDGPHWRRVSETARQGAHW
jgi:hypothetical protein